MGWSRRPTLPTCSFVIISQVLLALWGGSARAGLPFPVDPTVVCYITVAGEPALWRIAAFGSDNVPPWRDVWTPSLISIECINNLNPGAPVNVTLGKQLMQYIQPSVPLPPSMLLPPVYSSPPVYGNVAQPSPPPPSNPPRSLTATVSTSGVEVFESESDSGWSIVFNDQIQHLQLENSVLRGTPLSYDPLISCPSCKYVTVANVTMEELYGAAVEPIGDDYCWGRTVGALSFGGVLEAYVDRLTCTNVQGATDFACIWLGVVARPDVDHGVPAPGETPQGDPAPAVDPAGNTQVAKLDRIIRISNSVFLNNSVTTGECFDFSDTEQLGFGAVVVYGPNSVGARSLSSVELLNTVMLGNKGGYGSGLSIYRDAYGFLSLEDIMHVGVLNISRSSLEMNTATKHGGAVFMNLYSHLEVLHITQGSKVDDNSAGGSGGAVYHANKTDTITVEGSSSVSDNTAAESGGAFFVLSYIQQVSILSGSTVSGNKATSGGGGAVLVQNTDKTVTPLSITVHGSSHVDGNMAAKCGGAFGILGNVAELLVAQGSSLNNNTVGVSDGAQEELRGGAVYIGSCFAEGLQASSGNISRLLVSDSSSISYNVALYQGGAVFVEQDVIDGITIEGGSQANNNSVTGPLAEGGGAIAVYGSCSSLTIQDSSSISGNMAAGDITYEKGSQGGGVWIGGLLQKLVLTGGSRVSWNKAWNGGSAIVSGMSAEEELADVKHVMELLEVSNNSCICNNTAGQYRSSLYGAMYFRNTRVVNFTVTDRSCMCSNKVQSGSGFGGAVYAGKGLESFRICNGSSVSDNQGGNGGAIYIPNVQLVGDDANGTKLLPLQRFELCGGSRMDGNLAGISGGAIFIEGPAGEIIISNSSISHNRALVTGGAIHLTAMLKNLSISDSNLFNNSAVFGEGGFMHLMMVPSNQGQVSGTPTDISNSDTSQKLPDDGPYYLNIARSNISENSALKDGGAISINLRHWIRTVPDDMKRLQLQKDRVLYLKIADSTWDSNWAHYGAGGALAFLSLTPVLSTQQRMASVLMGARINITNTTFHTNTAGDDSTRLLYIQDVSPLRGNGGALFIWAEPFLLEDSPSEKKLLTNQTGYIMYDKSSGCDTTEADLVPGIQAFSNMTCWPEGSQACGVRLEGVSIRDNMAKGGYGGGFLLAHCAAKIINSNFRNNSADLDGGGFAFMDYAIPAYVAQPSYVRTTKDSSSSNSNSNIGVNPYPHAPILPISPPDTSPQTPRPSASTFGQSPLSINHYVDPQTPGAADVLLSRLQPSLEALQNVDTTRALQQPWLVIQHTTFTQNSGTNGGGVFLEVNRTAAIILDCTLADNTAQVQGGGAMLIGASTFAQVTAVLRNTTFEDNEAGTVGGGLAVQLTRSRAAVVLFNDTFKGNSATNGGGLFNVGVRGTSLLAWGCILHDNSANYGGGAALSYIMSASSSKFSTSPSPPPSPRPPSPAPAPPRPPRPPPPPPPINNIPAFTPVTAIVHFQQCRFTENQVLLSGGGIYLAAAGQNVLTLLEQSEVSLSSAALGGAIYLNATDGCIMRVSSCNITNNTANLQGGGAYSATTCGGQLMVGNGSYWSGNTAGVYGGAIMVNSADDVLISSSAGIAGVASGTGSSSSSQQPSACMYASLDLSNSSVVSNMAQQGGGIYASEDTVVVVQGTALMDNTALQFGGAMAAVRCSLLKFMNSSIINNRAAFSGGGVFNDKCIIFVMELGCLKQNMASTGGGVHISGISTGSTASNGGDASRRLLQAGYTANGTSMIDGSPVAILSRIDLRDNIATMGFDQVILSNLSVSSRSSANEYHLYQGHGGALFVSGRVGVAVSSSTAGPGNSANVGTVLATTQACSSDIGSVATLNSPGRTAAEKVADVGARTWSVAVSALSQAAQKECSLLVLRDTKLYWSLTSTVATLKQAARQKQLQLPLLWLQDLNVSALLANCSSQNVNSEDTGIFQLVQQAVPAWSRTNATTPPARSITDGNDMLPVLVSMLQACRDISVPSYNSQDGPLALAVPATHMRLISFSGLLLVPAGNTTQQLSGMNTSPGGARLEIAKDERRYLTSVSSNGTAFRDKDIEVLIITPNTPFSLEIQLYDGLGQPMGVDTPTFSVSLQVRPHGTVTAPNSEKLAALRSSGESMIRSTSGGIASWTDLDLLGWPGKYLLEVSAAIEGDALANTALPTIAGLQIHIELLPCEVGHELMATDSTGNSFYSCSSCRRDRLGLWRDQRTSLTQLLGDDKNTSIVWQRTKAIIKNLTSSSDESGNNDDEDSCPSCCRSCPPNAICPGGALVVPAAGFWHSAPNSPRMHRCPQPSACGKVETYGDELDDIWDTMLRQNFNISDAAAQNVTINVTDSTTMAIVSMSPELMTPLSLDALNMISLRNDNRSFLLSVCQQWWYNSFPPNRDTILEEQYSIPHQVIVPAAPCYLFYDPSFNSNANGGERRSYQQLQCATGYTGHLCAACLPGYSLGGDFSCTRCSSLGRTITIGLLAFWGTVALILFTTFSNLSQTRAETLEMEELSSLDLLKTLITHVQYFIIITKLGINYPPIITKYQSVLSSITGSENFIAYSPSCLFKDLASSGQAASQIVFGLGSPCTATLVSLVIWAVRYLTANQRMFHRVKASRWNNSRALHDILDHEVPSCPVPNSIAKGGAISPVNSKSAAKKVENCMVATLSPAVKKSEGKSAVRGLAPSSAELSGVTSITKPPAATLACVLQESMVQPELKQQPYVTLAIAESCSQPALLLAADARSVEHDIDTATLQQPAASAAAAALRAPAGMSLAKVESVPTTANTGPAAAAAAAAAPPAGSGLDSSGAKTTSSGMHQVGDDFHVHSNAETDIAEVSIQMDSSAPARSETDAHNVACVGVKRFGNGGHGSTQVPRPVTSYTGTHGKTSKGAQWAAAVKLMHQHQHFLSNLKSVQTSSTTAAAVAAVPGSQPGPHHSPAAPTTDLQSPSSVSPKNQTTDSLTSQHSPAAYGKQHVSQAGAQKTRTNPASLSEAIPTWTPAAKAARDDKLWSQTPFAAGPPPMDDVEDQLHGDKEEEQDEGAEDSGCYVKMRKLLQRYANPFHMLVFADQSVSLLQQLVVVIIVASFILFPSLCQVSLSMFACYKLDSGTGAFKENQKATWRRGYWVRDMQQECYAGVHKKLYVPVGIAAVLLFCLCPPIVYFLLTFRLRRKFNDPRMRVQYGFLYQQYKPEYFWWASMRQLQVLALVAVEVFGRALPVQQQSLMLLSVLIVIGAVNTTSSPERFPQLMILEFLSMCVLSLTLTLGLYFVRDDKEEQLSDAASTAVGAIILAINALYIFGVLIFSAKQNASRAKHMRKILSHSWGSLVTNFSRAIVRVEQRLSNATSSRRSSSRASHASLSNQDVRDPVVKERGGTARSGSNGKERTLRLNDGSAN